MLKGQVALITGGARGFGLATARTLAEQGCNIVLVDILQESLDAAAAEIRSLGVDCMGLQGDVTNFDQCSGIMDKIKDSYGNLDILINNAGVLRDDLTIKMKESDWDTVLNVNLKGVFHMTKAAVKLMIKARKGKIVNVASVVGLLGNPGQANYVASKAGVIGLTKTWAKEFAKRNINVNAVAPGLVITELTKNLTEAQREALISETPLGRFGTMNDVANGILFLASPLSDFITGVVLRIDGGLGTGV